MVAELLRPEALPCGQVVAVVATSVEVALPLAAPSQGLAEEIWALAPPSAVSPVELPLPREKAEELWLATVSAAEEA